jgi:anaerobic magnesium-protoporphyrin IX monomethyl ester cyclase
MIDRYHVLLLQAPVPGTDNRLAAKSTAIPPLGLGYLASTLLSHDFEVCIRDLDVEDIDMPALGKLLVEFQPGIVGISATTLSFKNGLNIARTVKQSSPESLVCMGGPHVTVSYQEVLRSSFVDAVVRSEGELSFLELSRAVAGGASPPFIVRGIVSRTGNDNTVSMVRERIDDLDLLPFPARHLMPLQLYKTPVTVLTSRGCPFACSFCASPVVLGKNYTARSSNNVVTEVKACVDSFGTESFCFVDDNLTHDAPRLMSICEGLNRVKIPAAPGKRLKWTCQSRVDEVSSELLQAMHDAGCTAIQFGMESGSQELLNKLGKKTTLQQIEQAVVWSRKAGISPVLSLVFPLPGETQETLQQTLDFIQRLYNAGAEEIIPSLLTPFPGTRFTGYRHELGLNLLTEDTDEYDFRTPVLSTRNFDRAATMKAYSRLLLLARRLGGNASGSAAARNAAVEN